MKLLLLVCVMLVLLLMVLFVAKVHHWFEVLYLQVAVMVCVLLSVQFTYSVGDVCMLFVVLVGASLCCHGGWFVVK